MLRIITLRPAPRQTFHQLVESCWNTIEAGDVAWNQEAHELTVERTTVNPDVQHRRTHYRIDPDGAVATIGIDTLP